MNDTRWLFIQDPETKVWVPHSKPTLDQIASAPLGSYWIENKQYTRCKGKSGWFIVFGNYPKEIKAFALVNAIYVIDSPIFLYTPTHTIH